MSTVEQLENLKEQKERLQSALQTIQQIISLQKENDTLSKQVKILKGKESVLYDKQSFLERENTELQSRVKKAKMSIMGSLLMQQPIEILICVAQFLDTKSCLQMRGVSKSMARVIESMPPFMDLKINEKNGGKPSSNIAIKNILVFAKTVHVDGRAVNDRTAAYLRQTTLEVVKQLNWENTTLLTLIYHPHESWYKATPAFLHSIDTQLARVKLIKRLPKIQIFLTSIPPARTALEPKTFEKILRDKQNQLTKIMNREVKYDFKTRVVGLRAGQVIAEYVIDIEFSNI